MALWYDLEIQVKSTKDALPGPLMVAMEALEKAGWSVLNNKQISLGTIEEEKEDVE